MMLNNKKKLWLHLPFKLWNVIKILQLLTVRLFVLIFKGDGIEHDLRAHLEIRYRLRNIWLDSQTILFRPKIKFKIHPDNRVAFEHFCYKSPDMVHEMDLFLECTHDKRRLLDIGALYGVFSLSFAAVSCQRQVLAVDASPLACKSLLYNINLNQFHNITPVECAISDSSGTIKMHYEWEHAVAAGTNQDDQMIEVSMVSGDNLCNFMNFKPDVIKIDVEGHEVKVLNGLLTTIIQNTPLLFLEVHPKKIIEEGCSLAELESFFCKLGYSAHLINGEVFPLTAFSSLRHLDRLVLRKQ